MISLKTSEEIEIMRQGGAILAGALETVGKMVEVGVRLKDIDKAVYEYIKERGGEPAFLNYRPYGAKTPYPASICASVNNIVVHGLPTDYELKEGDIVSIDAGVRFKGFITDAARTFPVGSVSKEASHLLEVTRTALKAAIAEAKAGRRLGDIGYAIETVAKKGKVAIVDLLTGHGVGRELHEEPTVYNYGEKGRGFLLKAGMTIAIEPMFSLGESSIRQTEDDEYATRDGSLAAHFEHTIAITEAGPVVLTE